MPVLVVHLPSSPAKYDQQDQDNVRRIIEQALATSFEVGAHASTHYCGGTDPLNLDDLCGPLPISFIEADPAATNKFLRSNTGVLSWEALVVGDIPAHASTHESGGGDDLDIGALAGTLIDAQVIQSNVTQHEAALTIDWTQLTSVPATFPPSAHASSHESGGSDEVDHNLLINLATGDVHTQYLLLAGRAGGQTAFGGTAATERLNFQGSSDADLGVIEFRSPVEWDVDWTDTPETQIVSFVPTVPSSGSAVTAFMYLQPIVTVDNALFIFSAVRDVGEFEWTVSPGFAVSTLFLAQPQYITRTGGINPAQAFVLASQAQMRNEGAGAGITVANHIGVSYSPTMVCTVSGDALTVTNHSAVNCAPIWSTVAGTTVNFGTIRGLKCASPVKGIFFPGAGVESMAAYYGIDFDNIAFAGNVPKVVVRSALAPASNAYFLLNAGGAQSSFGSGTINIIANMEFNADNIGDRFGAGDDVLINWNGSAFEWDFAVGDDLRLSASAGGNFILQGENFGGTGAEMRFGFDRFAFGQTSAVGNQVGLFVAPARATQVGGGWADFLLTQAGNLTIDHAMSDISAWVLNSIGLTAGAGSLTGFISTFTINGMTTSGIGSNDTHAFRHTGRRTGRGVDAFEPLSPAALTGNVNDYAPATGNSMRQVWRLTSDDLGVRTITGIAVQQGSDTQWVTNVGTVDNLILAHQNAGSAASNRIISPTGANLTLGPDESALLWHDTTTDRWRILYTTGA